MFNSPNNKTQIYGKTGSADRKTCLLNEEFYFFQYLFFFFLGGGGGGEMGYRCYRGVTDQFQTFEGL